MTIATRFATRRARRPSRKSNWGGWIRTTDLLINSRCTAPGALGSVASGRDERASVTDSRHTKRHTIRPLQLGGGNCGVGR